MNNVSSTLDEHLDILSNVHRRRLLTALAHGSSQNDWRIFADEEHQQKERPILMQQVHLPKLEDYGYIDWKRASKQVRKGPKFDEIKPLLMLLVDGREMYLDDVLAD